MLPITESQVRQTAVLCHLAAFLGLVLPFGSLIGPLVVWLVKREDDPFVDANGREAVNFQLSMLLYFGALVAIGFVTMFSTIGGMVMGSGMRSSGLAVGSVATLFGGFGLLVVVGLAITLLGLICPILAALKADKGQAFRYPLTLRLVR